MSGPKEKLLLHVCCAPCSGLLSQQLKGRFEIVVYFDNPNIWPESEFLKRAKEAEKFYGDQGVGFIITGWNHDEWKKSAEGLEQEPEKGRRCKSCYHYRLKNAAEFAAQNNFDYFTTSLLISPWKDAEALRNIGLALAKKRGVNFYAADFQANGGYNKSRAFAREQGFYAQKYCGCEYSAGARP